jgi:hypothetical protein
MENWWRVRLRRSQRRCATNMAMSGMKVELWLFMQRLFRRVSDLVRRKAILRVCFALSYQRGQGCRRKGQYCRKTYRSEVIKHGKAIDIDCDIIHKSGIAVNKAKRWEVEVKEKKMSPTVSHKTNHGGNVLDDNGDCYR